MIGALALLYLAAVEPFGFQKEASARDLMADFGARWVREEHRHFMDAAVCTYRPDAFGDEEPFAGMGGFPIAVVECAYSTPCQDAMLRPVWHEPFLGAYTTAEPESHNIAWQCPEMLRHDVLAEIDGGG